MGDFSNDSIFLQGAVQLRPSKGTSQSAVEVSLLTVTGVILQCTVYFDRGITPLKIKIKISNEKEKQSTKLDLFDSKI